jgi:hypothetical protein
MSVLLAGVVEQITAGIVSRLIAGIFEQKAFLVSTTEFLQQLCCMYFIVIIC